MTKIQETHIYLSNGSQKHLRDKSIWIAIYQKDYGILQTVNISLGHLPCVRQLVLLRTTLSLWLVEHSNHCGDIGNMTLRIPVKVADVDVHWVGRPRSWLSLQLMAPIYACINKGYSLLAVGDATDVTIDQWINGGTICRIRNWWRRKTHAENCLQFFRTVSTKYLTRRITTHLRRSKEQRIAKGLLDS